MFVTIGWNRHFHPGGLSDVRRRFEHMTRSLRLWSVAYVGLMALGCTGSVMDQTGGAPTPSGTQPGGGNQPGGSNGGGGGATNPGSPTVPGAALPSDADTVPGTAPLRRLSRLEYVNTIRDLLGIPVPPERLADFSADQDPNKAGFVNGGVVDAAQDARVFMQAAETLAQAALQKMPSLLPCNPIPTAAADQDACADKFLAGFGRRAYRRPLLPAEIADLSALYRAQKAADIGANFQQAIANVIGGVLQSPYFLYRHELGPNAPIKEGALVRYNPHEIASNLSYMLWASMPDDQLFQAADAGQLANGDQIAKQAWRMLADPRAKDALNDFHLQWLQIGVLGDLPKDPTLKDYSPAVAQSMLNETREFVSSVFQGPKADGKLETLLTSTSSIIDANLAKIYGVSVQGTGLQPVSFKATERAGLLTQATFLTAKADAIESHLIKRGNAVLTRLLCIPLEVPVNIDVPPLPEPQPGQTNRERVGVHSMSPCATCHTLIDPVGFAFENYDAIGKYRTTQEGKPVNASGAFPLDKGMATYKNAIELMPQLAKSHDVQDCMVKQWFRYTMRRGEIPSEDPSLNVVRKAFDVSGHDLRELVVAVTRTRAFSYRKPFAEEVMP
jgi:hypothetical protein